MSKRVFDSYHAPEEETAGVRKVLDEAGIPWFETSKGRWWIGSAGLWIKNDQDFARARDLIDRYQTEWREHHQNNTSSAETSQPTSLTQKLLVIAGIGAILYLLAFGFWI